MRFAASWAGHLAELLKDGHHRRAESRLRLGPLSGARAAGGLGSILVRAPRVGSYVSFLL